MLAAERPWSYTGSTTSMPLKPCSISSSSMSGWMARTRSCSPRPSVISSPSLQFGTAVRTRRGRPAGRDGQRAGSGTSASIVPRLRVNRWPSVASDGRASTSSCGPTTPGSSSAAAAAASCSMTRRAASADSALSAKTELRWMRCGASRKRSARRCAPGSGRGRRLASCPRPWHFRRSRSASPVSSTPC